MSSFTLKAGPDTDIWRKPPTKDIYNAPSGVPSGYSSNKGPLSSFESASVSTSFKWTERYDQGGLLLAFRRAGSDPAAAPQKWIKTGIEFYNGKPMLSVVSCDTWADWSVAPLGTAPATAEEADKTWTRLLVQREGDHNGAGLWVYQVLENGEKVPLREICWVFAEQDGWELEVAAMAARPASSATSDLEVKFRDFEVKWT